MLSSSSREKRRGTHPQGRAVMRWKKVVEDLNVCLSWEHKSWNLPIRSNHFSERRKLRCSCCCKVERATIFPAKKSSFKKEREKNSYVLIHILHVFGNALYNISWSSDVFVFKCWCLVEPKNKLAFILATLKCIIWKKISHTSEELI